MDFIDTPSECKALVPYTGTVDTVYRPRHFGSEIFHSVVESGSTLQSLFGDIYPYVQVELNSKKLSLDDWNSYVLQDKDHLLIYANPPGKDALRTVLMIMLVVAVNQMTFGNAGPLTTALLKASIVFIGTMAINALIPPTVPQTPDPLQTGVVRGSITGASNQIALFQPLPKLFGTFRYFPPLAAKYFTEVSGDDQFLRMIVNLGYGPLRIGNHVITTPSTRGITVSGFTVVDSFTFSPRKGLTTPMPANTIRIGETSVEVFQEAEYMIGNVDFIDEITNVQETSLNVVYEGQTSGSLSAFQNPNGTIQKFVNEAGNATIQTTSANTEEISVDITFPNGLWTMNGGGSFSNFAAASFIIEYSLTGLGIWTPIPEYVAMTGRVDVALTPTTFRLDVPENIFFQANLNLKYYQDQWDGRTIRIASGTGAGQTRTVTLTTVDLISDTVEGAPIAFMGPLTVTVDSPWSPQLDSSSVFEILVDDGEFFIYGPTRDTIRRSVSWPVSTGQYDVRVTRKRTYYQYKEVVFTQAIWTTIRSFNSGIAWAEKDTILLEMRIKASDELNGIIQDLNVLASSVVQVNNGSTWSWQVSNNPAWLYYDALTGDQVKRPVPEARIDIATLLDWAAFCTTEGFTYNFLHNGAETILQRIAAIAAVGRGSWAMKEGKFSVVFDDEQVTPVQMISPRNAKDFKMQKLFQTPPHALRVRYVSPDAFTDDEVIAYNDGFDASTATEFEVFQTQGVTNPTQAWKLGRYFERQAALRPETYQVTMDFENLVATRGDLVKLAYDVIEVGLAWGRIVSVVTSGNDVTDITLDQECIMEVGKNYAVRVRKSDNTQVVQQVQTNAGIFKTLTFTTPIPGPAVGDLVLFGELGVESLTAKVLSVEYHSDFVAELTLVPDAAGIYNLDAPPTFNPILTLPQDITKIPPPVPIIDYVESGTGALYRDTDGSVKSSVMVGFKFLSSNNFLPVAEVEARYRQMQNELWIYTKIPAGNGSIRLTQVEDRALVAFQIRSISKFGGKSDWTDARSQTVDGKTINPSDVPDFQASQNGPVVMFTWDPVPDLDLFGYEIRYGARTTSTWDSAVLLTNAEAGTQIASASVPPGDWKFFIKAIDTSRNRSTNARTTDLVVAQELDIIFQQEQSPGWAGNRVSSFDGVDDYAEVAYNAAFDFERTDAFSLVVRLRTTGTGTYVIIDKHVDGPSRGYNLVSANGGIRCNIRNDDAPVPQNAIVVESAPSLINDGNWHTVGWTYNGSSLASGVVLYRDGAAVSATVTVDNLSATIAGNAPLSFGRRTEGPAFHFPGDIADAWLYKRVLTAQEMSDFYLGKGGDVSVTNRIGHWNFAENNSSQVYDDSGSELHATLNGPTLASGMQAFNFVKHWSGVLVPESTKKASELTNEELFEQFVPFPFTICRFHSPEVDTDFDDTSRIWGSIGATLGRGIVTGNADPWLEVDFREELGAYDGFEWWTVGDRTGRFYRHRAVLDTSIGNAYLTSFLPSVDQLERSETGQNIAVGVGGSVVNFVDQFHKIPSVVATVVGGGTGRYVTVTSVTKTGFTATVFDSAGTSVAGSINYNATGV